VSGVLIVPLVPSGDVIRVLPVAGVARRRTVFRVAEVRHFFLGDLDPVMGAVMGAAMVGVVIPVVMVIHLH
jgi:hypothetical protein